MVVSSSSSSLFDVVDSLYHSVAFRRRRRFILVSSFLSFSHLIFFSFSLVGSLCARECVVIVCRRSLGLAHFIFSGLLVATTRTHTH